MFPRIFLRLAWVFLTLGLTAGFAQTASKVKVEVRAARFGLVSPAGANVRWFEADIEVDTRVVGGRSPFADRVRVALDLGTRVLGGTYRFYHSEVEAVTLENGIAHFRFYLPPEVVKRDGLGGEPEFWSVAITAAGEPQPEVPRNFSNTLLGLGRMASFEAKLATEAPANAGVFQPQHLTPFATEYPQATPTALRRNR